MDFATYNRATRAQDGEWMHVAHPDTLRPLFMKMDGKKATASEEENDAPIRVLVQGISSPELRQMHKAYEDRLALIRAKMTRANGQGEVVALQKQASELEEKHGLAMIATAIKGWENLPFNGEVLAFSDDAKSQIVPPFGSMNHPTEWLAEQVAMFSRDRSNFFTKPVTS